MTTPSVTDTTTDVVVVVAASGALGTPPVATDALADAVEALTAVRATTAREHVQQAAFVLHQEQATTIAYEHELVVTECRLTAPPAVSMTRLRPPTLPSSTPRMSVSKASGP
jgi:hypothetical protein